jgi:hypothetical protein
MHLSSLFILPVPAILKRPVERDGPGPWTIVDAAAAIPALLRVQDNRGFALFRMGNIYIYLADLDTMVAPVADYRIEQHRVVRRDDIGHRDDFFLGHLSLQSYGRQ